MSGNPGLVRFGIFEVEPHTGELRKQGVRVKLRDQPFQILLLLLTHAGEVVSRDELQKQLWPGDTFVDFDRGLNKAVNHLRDALGDSAESPRFIETLPKRGYRFIAPVRADGHECGLETELVAPNPNGGMVSETAPLHPTTPRTVDSLVGARAIGFRWLLAGIAVVLAGIGIARLWRVPQPPDLPMMRFSVDLGPDAVAGRTLGGAMLNPVISPDGTLLVFSARSVGEGYQLATRRLDQSLVNLLAGTEGAYDPFFSPDGHWIGFFAGRKLKKIPVHGGASVSLCDSDSSPGASSWGEDGSIIANLDRFHLFRVSANGGEAQIVGRPEEHGEGTWRWPQILPGGENVLFTGAVAASAAAFYDANVEVLSLKSGQVKIIQRRASFGRYLPTGHLVYFSNGTLFGVPFNLARLEIHGTPKPLLENIADPETTAAGRLFFSRTGIALLNVGRETGVARLGWMDRAGKVQPIADTSTKAETPRLSPDGNRLAVTTAGDLFVSDLRRGILTRLTFDAALNRHPVWAPDGKHIVYASDIQTEKGEYAVWWIRSDGSGQPYRMFGERTPLQTFSISPDGRRLAFVRTDNGMNFQIWTLPLDLADPDHPQAGKPEPFARESQSQVDPAFSPDGRWVAYVSTSGAGGGGQVFVRPFPFAPSAGRWPISNGAGKFPTWSRNSRELFYLDGGNHIMVAGYMARQDTFVAEKPRLWSTTPLFRPANNSLWNMDLAPDGQRLLVLAAVEPEGGEKANVHVTVLLNFFDEVRRKSPEGGR